MFVLIIFVILLRAFAPAAAATAAASVNAASRVSTTTSHEDGGNIETIFTVLEEGRSVHECTGKERWTRYTEEKQQSIHDFIGCARQPRPVSLGP